MSCMLSVGLRAGMGLLCGVLVLASAAPAVADPKPLTEEEQAKVDAAIDKGVAFLKKAQTKDGDFRGKMYEDGRFLLAQCALPAYALLESGVPVDDPAIQKAAGFLRPLVLVNDWTYELSLAILFFDRLGDPKDKPLIQMCALRLIAGQHRTGGWSYRCPVLNDKTAVDLLTCLKELNKRMKGERPRGQALNDMDLPAVLQGLTVFQSANRLPWQEPPVNSNSKIEAQCRVSLAGRSDNSNTQFALLGLWAARRHGVAVEPALEIAVERFERFHIYPFGYWLYDTDSELGSTSRKSMTCVGLIGLAIGRGLKFATPGSPGGAEKDVHVLRALAALSRQIGKPLGHLPKRVELQDLYFLWSLERVGMLYNLPDIAGKDWYRWGAQGLVTNQQKDGWWPKPVDKTEKMRDYKATLNTSFTLLFLKRSHPMKDLTAKLPFTAKQLNDGIATLRVTDRYPVRTITPSSPSARKEKEP